MKLRRMAAAAAMLAIGVAVGRTASVAQDNKDAEAQAKSLAMQCAKANLKLSQMNLARIQQLNRRVPGTLIAGMVQQFSEEAELAQAEVDIFEKYPEGNPYQACVERMRLALRTAKDRAERALKTHDKAPEIVSKADVERVRQIAVIADLQLQRGLALADASPQAQLEWQLEVYGDEIDRVRIYTYLLGQNRFGEFAPGL